MIRSELLAALADRHPRLGAEELDAAADLIFDAIVGRLAGGGRVELRGFGTFSTRRRGPRLGRNPRTGVTVDVDAKRVPYFKVGKALHDRLNPPAPRTA